MIADTAKMLADSRTVIQQCKPEVAAGFARPASTACPGVRRVTVREQ